jgi:hypothetical protein
MTQPEWALGYAWDIVLRAPRTPPRRRGSAR